jgi:integration host factor subunit alpha
LIPAKDLKADFSMRELDLKEVDDMSTSSLAVERLAADAGKESSTTLTKAELADLLFERVGLNKREAKDMVETFFEEIRFTLQRGDSVKLSGFGNFQLRDKPQRPGRNPKTGEAIPITARRVVTFHASQKLKAMVEAVSSRRT